MSAGKVVVDAEAMIKWLDEGEAWQRKGRELFTAGFTSKPAEVSVNASGISWRLKGGTPANLDDGFAWDFAADRDGAVPPEKAQLVEYLKRYGKAQIQSFEITLSGNGRFLQRKKIKAGG